MTRNPALEGELLNRFQAHVVAFSDGAHRDTVRLADAVIADLGTVAGVLEVKTMLVEADGGSLRFTAMVRTGPREWLPDLVAVLAPYPDGERRALPLASVPTGGP